MLYGYRQVEQSRKSRFEARFQNLRVFEKLAVVTAVVSCLGVEPLNKRASNSPFSRNIRSVFSISAGTARQEPISGAQSRSGREILACTLNSGKLLIFVAVARSVDMIA